MFLYGASGHCKVVIDAIESSSNNTIEAIFDDNPKSDFISGIPVTIASSKLLQKSKNFIVSIGNNTLRKKIVKNLNTNYVTVIHSKATIAKTVEIGMGTVVFAGAIINTDAKIGMHCIDNSGVVIEHDCEIGNYVHVSPNASLAGNVKVGEGTHIGIGSTVIQGIKIGKWVTVGAGTVIIKDIPDYAVVVGNPGKIIKYNEIDSDV